jgi:hypothetical protein
MQLPRTEKLNLFFSKIREITFWQRLFSWKAIRNLSYEAYEEYKALEKSIAAIQSDHEALGKRFATIATHSEGLQSKITQYEKAEIKKDAETVSFQRKIEELNNIISGINKTLSKHETTEEERSKSYENKITQLNQLKETLNNEIKRLNDERVEEQKVVHEKMKRQWAEHETSVQQTIKIICQQHYIKYVDAVPFKGNPDNTIEICEEYIIFDAKCPANNDLTNFPKYLKLQTESIKKYANQDNVKKDIFLVVPSNTIHTVSQLVYNMGDYNVYIITKDSLEPIILSLQKIENYQFAEQLSPEERENICRVIGKFAHTTKRKIQIDQFFANEFLVRCKNDLPEDILQQVIEYEKAEKLNPPPEKKAKQILTKDLQDKNDLINAEAHIRGVTIPLNFEEFKNME